MIAISLPPLRVSLTSCLLSMILRKTAPASFLEIKELLRKTCTKNKKTADSSAEIIRQRQFFRRDERGFQDLGRVAIPFGHCFLSEGLALRRHTLPPLFFNAKKQRAQRFAKLCETQRSLRLCVEIVESKFVYC